MNLVWLIARRELRAYLLSPMGYGIIAALLCLHGLFFNVTLLQGELSSYAVVEGFFYQSAGFVAAVGVLLSMRLFTEERQTGSVMLLLTSPAAEWQLVTGKFLGAYLFLLGYLLLSAYMPGLILVNGSITPGHLGAGYLGLALLGAVVIALGTLASALVSSQVLAAVLGAALVTLLFICWFLAGAVEGVLGEVIAYLDLMMQHHMSFARGIIKLSTILYELSLTYLALLAASLTLLLQRWSH